MIMVDTSVWIDLFRKRKNKYTDRLKSYIENEEDLCYNGLVLTEILQGLTSETECGRILAVFANLVFLPMPYQGCLLAADLYRTIRKKGKTIRNTVDCLIAACAVLHDVELLHNDKDFNILAGISELKLSEV